MGKQSLRIASLALAGIAAIAVQPASADAKGAKMENREKAVALLNSIQTGDPAPAGEHINPAKYIQHNLAAADGLQGFGALMAQLPKGSAKVRVVRAFQDGDFAFTHTEYDFFGPKIGFDIFRFEKGKIVEHWDNLQETVAKTPSGHTMIDGPTEIRDRNLTEANKTLVKAFVTDILVDGKMDRLAGYYDGDNYIQHNPHVPDKVSGLGAALEAMAKQGVTMKYAKIHKVLGEGNFVLAASEGTFAGKPTSFYDLFRVEKGKIAEHWDTMETIPDAKEWKNTNGKF
jgi:predicted SnoaL-like aldol condensation-catalyzing enzyme